MAATYLPPKAKAAAEAAEIKRDPSKILTTANFPTLGRTEAPIALAGPPLDFLKRVKESEEERRRREEEAAKLDPNGILGKTQEALEAMGWAVLPTSPAAANAAWERLSSAESPAEHL